MIFRDRIHAAHSLFPYLKKYAGQDVIVLSIPRGGVPLGYEIARHFGWEMGIILTKKIGHPMNKEYAIGAVGLDTIILDSGHPDVSETYLNEETARIRDILIERSEKFSCLHDLDNLKNKVVIIVDDGIATGFTIRASIAIIRKKKPLKIVIAVPVASPRIVSELEKLTDDLIVLLRPDDFMGVGQFYEDFSEVTDDDVLNYLRLIK